MVIHSKIIFYVLQDGCRLTWTSKVLPNNGPYPKIMGVWSVLADTLEVQARLGARRLEMKEVDGNFRACASGQNFGACAPMSNVQQRVQVDLRFRAWVSSLG